MCLYLFFGYKLIYIEIKTAFLFSLSVKIGLSILLQSRINLCGSNVSLRPCLFVIPITLTPAIPRIIYFCQNLQENSFHYRAISSTPQALDLARESKPSNTRTHEGGGAFAFLNIHSHIAV